MTTQLERMKIDALTACNIADLDKHLAAFNEASARLTADGAQLAADIGELDAKADSADVAKELSATAAAVRRHCVAVLGLLGRLPAVRKAVADAADGIAARLDGELAKIKARVSAALDTEEIDGRALAAALAHHPKYNAAEAELRAVRAAVASVAMPEAERIAATARALLRDLNWRGVLALPSLLPEAEPARPEAQPAPPPRVVIVPRGSKFEKVDFNTGMVTRPDQTNEIIVGRTVVREQGTGKTLGYVG